MFRRLLRLFVLVAFVYACWLALMATHEFGHVVHAAVSGGRAERVVIPLLGFSRTDVSPNPHPQFVAWGGPIWGCLLPLAIWAVRARFSRGRHDAYAAFFAGLCLVANGAYVGLGWLMTAGDGHDLVRHGAPVWVMVLVGTLALTGGLILWDRSARRRRRVGRASARR